MFQVTCLVASLGSEHASKSELLGERNLGLYSRRDLASSNALTSIGAHFSGRR